jgi:hypothetical protein
MEEQIVRLVEVKDALFSTFNQIEDYLTENIPVDANPIFLSTGQEEMDSRLYNIRNAVAMLMEEATDDTKQRIKEELLGKYEEG